MLYLPPGAAVCRETDAEWTIAEHLLARISDQLLQGDDAKPLPRPGDERRKREKAQRMAERARKHQRERARVNYDNFTF